MRLVILVLVLLTMYLQYGLWYTRGGRHDVEKLKTSVQEQKDEIARLKERNRSLAAEVMDLKQGLEAIEERARSEMGMIKNGEVFFRITDPNHEHDQPQSPSALGKGVEPPLEPPLDPLASGDAVATDSPDLPPVAQEQAASVKPMVKAIVGAAAAKAAAGIGNKAPAPATRAAASAAPKPSAVPKASVTASGKPAVKAPSATAIKPAPRTASAAKAKSPAGATVNAGGRTTAPASLPRTAPKIPSNALPPRKATAFE